MFFSFANYLLVWPFLIFNKCYHQPGFTGFLTGNFGRPKYCYKKAIHIVMISSAVVFGLLVFCSWETSSQAYCISALYRSNCPINMVFELLTYVGASRSRGTIFKESFCWWTASRHRRRLVKQLDLDFWNQQGKTKVQMLGVVEHFYGIVKTS